MQYFCGMEVIKVPLYRQIQARKHKKKRINKKWLKRYGMKIVQTRPKLDKCFIAMGKVMIPEELWDEFQKGLRVYS
jgi:hypothetical protein